MEGDWAELRTVRDVSHWVNDPVQVQGNRGMGVSMRPHTVSQHHSSLAPPPEPNRDKTPRRIIIILKLFIYFHESNKCVYMTRMKADAIACLC